ncbi:MAG TPA: hypothetical protein DCM14_03685 [Clostridiales bacterium UBA8153]|nr:hypothetical protein [Clostridiales bacterium UBA8153]
MAEKPPVDRDGRVDARVTEGGYAAVLTVTPPQGTGAWPSVADGLRVLKQAGVTFGIEKDLVAETIRAGPHGQPVVVAQGRRPKPGIDARIVYSFGLEKHKRPSERSDGTVNHHELGIVENVQKGQVVAMKIPASPGAAGVLVDGTVVAGLPGRDRPLAAGKNTVLVDDGTRLVSLGDGQPVLAGGGRVSVLPVFSISGNVDFGTGNVDFVGTVEVRGSISPGFVVKARGDILVRGSSAALLLEAGQDVVVDRGIQGQHRGRVVAGRDVRAGFIENAEVNCGRNLYASSVLHSRVEAAGRVEILGGKGLIAGGCVRAREAILARSIGSPLATITEVQVGVLPRIRAELEKSVAELEKCRRVIFELERQLEKAQGSGDSGPAATHVRARLLALTQQLQEARERREVLAAQIQDLQGALRDESEGLVVSDLIHPGVKVTLGSRSLSIPETRTKVRFHQGAALE